MKKSKLSLSLVTTFIAALGMSACGKVSKNNDALVTFTGYNGQKISVITNDLYHDYAKTSSGISIFYNAMLEVLIRYEYEDNNSVLRQYSAQTDDEDKQVKSASTIKREAEEKLAGLKKEAKQNAKSNDTKYSTEWENILNQNGVENEKELLQKLIYDLEKDEVEDWYYNVNENALLAEYIGVDANGAGLKAENRLVPAKYPYHIRHILASVSNGGSDYTRTTITEDEASNLANITKALYDGRLDFGDIAKQFSGDEGSAKLKGSVGIMDTSTSFVNEFKYGIYAYDAIYNAQKNHGSKGGTAISDTTEVDAGLGINGDFKDIKADAETTVKQKLTDIGLTYVPYNAFSAIGKYFDTDRDAKGRTVNDNNANYYPRNIYFNKYLNHHDVFVITNNVLPESDLTGAIDETSAVDTTITLAAEGKTGFRHVDGLGLGSSQAILTDENGNPIIGVRSTHGIHFMIIEKSVYDQDVDAYYSPLTPDDDGYDENANNYVNYEGGSDKSVYIDRAQTIEDTIKKFDSTYDYRLYEFFLGEENGKVAFHTDEASGLDIAAAVEKYITSQRENTNWNSDKTINEAWGTYLELIEQQNAERSNGTDSRLISEMCALKYSDGLDDSAYQEGGACYYYEK